MELLGMVMLLLLVGALIVWPLFRRSEAVEAPGARTRAGGSGAPEPSRSRAVLNAIKELEFDYATGKLADDDYRMLRARYETKAVEALAAPPSPPAPGDLDATLEAEIRAARGRRFCTACGGALPRGAKFCPACGTAVGVSA